jgi:hypothetical protein
MKNQTYLFMHLPKTAGKLITSLVESNFNDAEKCIFLFDETFHRKRLNLIKNDKYKNIRLFAGHLSYEFVNLIEPSYIFTFMRDPIDRVLSNYFYWRQEGINDKIQNQQGELCNLIDPNLSWEEDLIRHLSNPNDSFKSLELSNLQTWQLAKNLYKRDGLTESEAIKTAIKNLETLSFVGIYKNMEDDLKYLFQNQNWTLPAEIPVINPTKKRKTVADLDSSLIDEIRRANSLDVELYQYALENCYSVKTN